MASIGIILAALRAGNQAASSVVANTISDIPAMELKLRAQDIRPCRRKLRYRRAGS